MLKIGEIEIGKDIDKWRVETICFVSLFLNFPDILVDGNV